MNRFPMILWILLPTSMCMTEALQTALIVRDSTSSLCHVETGALRDTLRVGHVADSVGILPSEPRPDYAAHKEWFLAGEEAIRYMGQRYFRFGTPLAALPEDASDGGIIIRVGKYDDVPVYAEPEHKDEPFQIYFPVNPDCQFQMYAEASSIR